MLGNERHYFAGGNTAKGFYSLYDSSLKGLDRVYILKGGPGTGKSSLMKWLGEKWSKAGYDIEVLHCSSDNDSIDGVIIPKLKVGVVDGTAPHVIEPTAPGAIEEYVNLGEAWNSELLAIQKEGILAIKDQIKEAYGRAYATFKEALDIHDEWEAFYIENMDFAKADELTDSLIENFFGGIQLNKEADVRHRFLGAATPDGPVDFIQNLTKDVAKRYFIKGRPGSGKSTMLKKLVKAAEEKGLDVEVYHCGFDPHSLDMLIVRELGLAIFDSTSPHEHFPENKGDEIIDMYRAVINDGTDEKYHSEIADVKSRYQDRMEKATSFLAQAKSYHDELEKIYVEAMNFKVIDQIKEKINDSIEKRV